MVVKNGLTILKFKAIFIIFNISAKTLLEYTYDKNNNIKSIKDITGKSSI